MSSYQYLEFIAIDRHLTALEMDRLRCTSTRAQITPVSFVNEYSYGGFKSSAHDIMSHYFDAHVYISNWAEAIFMLRLPKEAIDQNTLEAYCIGPHLEFKASPEHWILTWSLGETDNYGRFNYVEGSGWMARLVPLRDELLRGDLRSLYIGWLKSVTEEDTNPDMLEPMALQGIGHLTAAQQALAEYLEVDEEMLAGCETGDLENSPETVSEAELDAWLNKLPKSEALGYLRQLLAGQGTLAEIKLNQRRAAWRAKLTPPLGNRRSVKELWQMAEQAKDARLIREQEVKQLAEEDRKKKREARLAKLAANPTLAWNEAHEAARKGNAEAYKATCQQLTTLQEAYSKHISLVAFQKELQNFMGEHLRRRTLTQRLVEAGLWKDR